MTTEPTEPHWAAPRGELHWLQRECMAEWCGVADARSMRRLALDRAHQIPWPIRMALYGWAWALDRFGRHVTYRPAVQDDVCPYRSDASAAIRREELMAWKPGHLPRCYDCGDWIMGDVEGAARHWCRKCLEAKKTRESSKARTA